MEKTIQRGDIWLIDFSPARGSQQAGLRPGVVVQCDAVNSAAGKTLLVLPFTTNLNKKAFFFTAFIPKSQHSGLKKDGVALADQLTVVNKSQCLKKFRNLNTAEIKAVNRALRTILQLV